MASILVIDDDPDVCVLTQEMLEAAGHQVVLAADGLEGIDAHRRRRPDVVVTDLFMPGKDGIETIIELRQERPGVRVVAISGGGRTVPGTRYLAAALVLGATVLTKPFDAAALLAAVEHALRGGDGDDTPLG